MKTSIKLSLAAAIVLQTGCADLNIELQQTSRVVTAASRNPVVNDTDIQGSERIQGKSPIGVSAENNIASDTSKTTVIDADVSGPEK